MSLTPSERSERDEKIADHRLVGEFRYLISEAIRLGRIGNAATVMSRDEFSARQRDYLTLLRSSLAREAEAKKALDGARPLVDEMSSDLKAYDERSFDPHNDVSDFIPDMQKSIAKLRALLPQEITKP